MLTLCSGMVLKLCSYFMVCHVLLCPALHPTLYPSQHTQSQLDERKLTCYFRGAHCISLRISPSEFCTFWDGWSVFECVICLKVLLFPSFMVYHFQNPNKLSISRQRSKERKEVG